MFHFILARKFGLNQNYYKCLTTKHPTSNIAIFTKDQNGRLGYRGNRKDENCNNPSSCQESFKAYQTSGPGDSGGPWSNKVKIDIEVDTSDNDEPSTSAKRRKNTEKRHVIIGIHASGIIKASCGKPLKMTKCVQKTTKLTEDIVAWIKSMDKMNFKSN